MNAASKWSLSLLVACSFTLTGVRAYSQTNPPPDPAAPPPEAPPAAIEAAPPAPPPAAPAPEATTAVPQAPMAPTPSAAAMPMVPAAQAPLKIETPNKSTIKFGLLFQPQFQMLQGNPGVDSAAYNLYIRRTRILVGGTLFGVLDYFLDTDFPNLFLANNAAGAMMTPADELKATPGMNIQDAFITYKPLGDMLKIDAGYMLPPLAHNAVQGATTLYSWDYFAYTFQSGNSF